MTEKNLQELNEAVRAIYLESKKVLLRLPRSARKPTGLIIRS